MLKIERKKLIETELQKKGSILISNMSKIIQCSEETVRRDLSELEQEGKLIKIHGGAYLPDDYDKSAPIYLRETLFSNVKEKISSITFDKYIKENEVIMLDSSTTCLALAKKIFNSNIKITIITNSLRICNLCNESTTNIKIICLGGTYRARTSSFVGYETTSALSQYVADKCFISCPAFDIKYGLLDNNTKESQIRKSYLKQSIKHYFIGDHTKFNESANIIIDNIQVLDGIITNEKLPKNIENSLEDNDITVTYS